MVLILFLSITEGFFLEKVIKDGVCYERVVIKSNYQYRSEPPPEIPRVRGSDTTILWVDRNHQKAIIQSIGISGDGMSIIGYWDLNSPRVSLYRSLGAGLPLWNFSGSFPWSYGGHRLGISNDGRVISLANKTGIYCWEDCGPDPKWLYPLASRGSVASRDGHRIAAVTEAGILLLLDESGDTLWSFPFSEVERFQGLDISDDGSIVAVTVYDSCFVIESGHLRDRIPIGTSSCGTQYAAKISGDGKYLVTGDYYGRVKLFRWDGNSYLEVWSAPVGNPWVTDVGISSDGSTIVCGTGYANGKLVLFDSSSATPLWQFQGYGGYGAMVASVTISADGSRIAAASWGDTAKVGDFYVFTLHERNDPTPIIGITRNEERGSLFGVAISESGELIATGGKAVHAYEWGNGGEVYAILAGRYYDHNVGPIEILKPERLLKRGDILNPEAGYYNFGDSTESFPVYLEIWDSTGIRIYLDSGFITGLEPDSTRYDTFPTWTVPSYGTYLTVTYTGLVGDQYPGDDTIKTVSICYHNGAVVSVKPPFSEQTINYRFQPIITVKNSGSYPDTILGIVAIRDSLGQELYRDSATAYLEPGQSQRLILSEFQTPAIGRYTASGIVRVKEDYIKEDDSIGFSFLSRYEIIYDDGTPEGYYWVGAHDNDKFAVRFTPLIGPPHYLTGARVYVNRKDPFDYIQLCPDASGLPDTANPIQTVYNVSAGSAPGWAIIPFDTIGLDSQELWIVLHWPDNSPPLGIGADDAQPLDLRSWWYSNGSGWTRWTRHDWMVRMTIEPEIGIASRDRFTNWIGNFAPNPFSTSGIIPLVVAEPTKVKAVVYDPIGRLVRILTDRLFTPGVHKIVWDGRDGTGKNRAGIYFIRLEMGEVKRIFKVVRIR